MGQVFPAHLFLIVQLWYSPASKGMGAGAYRLLTATPHTSKRYLERVSEYVARKCLQGLLFPGASETSCTKDVFVNWVSSW